MTWLKNKHFWLPFSIAALLLGTFFAWELNMLGTILPQFPRPAPTQMELLFAGALWLLLSLNIGLFYWQTKYGTCSVGSKRATKIGGVIGAIALLCPACLLLPLAIFGISLSLAFLGPFIPLLRIIALILLSVSTVMLWPKK